ncbi:hypothetical protein EUGRSUZ_J02389 [Eucalyptus grandis]|uniref:Uncharacterized protein n=2 Tax=Eucalyptus grandis TaxID=71139 RepID=A0ACC3J851_EUCGR|nr:hypothetical protein EUGRSUZ_J02389 [Eucalyptus grandis]
MAGFFSIGSGGRGTHKQQSHPPAVAEELETQQANNSISVDPGWLWYRNGVVSSSSSSHKGFELCHQLQPQQQLQLQHQQDLYLSSPPSPRMNASDDESLRSGPSAFLLMREGGISCQDCGNQAKKDCVHFRCRTCCKSRGLPCDTHVKSTWVPASRRRERQQLQLLHGGDCVKRLREDHDLPHANSSGLEMGNFPAEVNSSALFRCVRVSSIDDNDDQYAYQTAVNIGGHVFKGILYDQGPDHANYMAAGESSSVHLGGDGSGGIQQLSLIAAAAAGDTMTTQEDGNNNAAVSQVAAPLFDPSSMYPTQLNNFMGGAQFFPHPR